MIKSSDQLDFLDFLSILSFLIGVMNLQENVTQGDIQEVMQNLSKNADRLLVEIHDHLTAQDDKLSEILERVEDTKG